MFFQAENGIRGLVRSRGLGDVYKRQAQDTDYILLDEPLNNLDMKHARGMMRLLASAARDLGKTVVVVLHDINFASCYACLLYTSDAADDLLCVDPGGRPIIKKKKQYLTCSALQCHAIRHKQHEIPASTTSIVPHSPPC